MPRPLASTSLTRISDLAVVPSLRDQSPHLDFWGSDVRNDTREGDTLWVNYTTSHFSSSSLRTPEHLAGLNPSAIPRQPSIQAEGFWDRGAVDAALV